MTQPLPMQSPPLLRTADPHSTRILYLARFAPDDPIFSVKPEGITSGYAEYHFRLFEALQSIGYRVASSSGPYAALMAGGNVDFVFSLGNRMQLRNPELLVPAICTYLRLPCLGAPPNIRALAEDKYLSKLAFAALGLPVAPGRAYLPGGALEPPEFAGPYFVKDRFGAASEGVTEASLQDSWQGAARIIADLHDQRQGSAGGAVLPGHRPSPSRCSDMPLISCRAMSRHVPTRSAPSSPLT